MSTFVALLASALAYSAVLVLAVLGLLLLQKASGVVNFAHGDLITLGGYLAVWAIVDLGLPTVAGYLIAILLMAAVGVGLERVAYAPLRNRPPTVVLIATLAAALVIRAVIALWQGSTPRRLPTPVGNNVVHVLGATIADQRLFVIAIAVIAVAATWWMFERTGFGRQLRALAADPMAAQLCGVRVRRVSMIAWGMSAALAGLAGILLAPLSALDLTSGFSVMLGAFAAAVVGGFGSLGGAVLGALLIGFLQQLVGGYVLVNYASVLPYAVLLLILAVRPQGLLGRTAARL